MEITREHMVPVADLYSHLSSFKNLSEQYILKIISKLQLALISKNENEALKNAGLNNKMPDGWWTSKSLDPLERYRAAGLKDSIWMRF